MGIYEILHRIDLKALANQGKIIAKFGNGKVVESEKSILKLDGKLKTCSFIC